MPANFPGLTVAGLRRLPADNALWSLKDMQKARRARAIAIARSRDDAAPKRMQILMLALGATLALLALPAWH